MFFANNPQGERAKVGGRLSMKTDRIRAIVRASLQMVNTPMHELVVESSKVKRDVVITKA